MRIGELSGRLGVSSATLRHYESVGLLGRPRRSPGGYRLYDGAAEERMRFILRAKALDLSLAEIRLLLELGEDDSSGEGRAAVLKMVARKIVEVRERAKEAEAFAAQLIHVNTHGVGQCGEGGGDASGRTALQEEDSQRPRRPPSKGRPVKPGASPVSVGGQKWSA